ARVDRPHGVADAPVDRADHFLTAFGKRAGDLHHPRAQPLVERLGAGIERLLDAGEALIERGGDLGALAADAGVELLEVRAHRLRAFARLVAEALHDAVAGRLDLTEALIERRGDFSALAADAGVELLEMRAHRLGNLARLFAEAVDHVVAGPLDAREAV